MPCPKCASDRLSIRNVNGFERVIHFLTGMRKYRCRECNFAFRTPDRRRFPRESASPDKASYGNMSAKTNPSRSTISPV